MFSLIGCLHRQIIAIIYFAAAPELGFHSRDNEKPLQMIVSGHANRFDVFIGIGRLKLVPGAVRWLAAGPCTGRERFCFT